MLIIFPLGAGIVGIFYFRMYQKVRAWSSLVTGSLWIIYSIYEYMIYTRILCSGECNIRVDLLLIYPIILVFSLIASVSYYYKKKKLSSIE